jgi:hypothetical protein
LFEKDKRKFISLWVSTLLEIQDSEYSIGKRNQCYRMSAKAHLQIL